jgi:diguanylate cyclase (GGDEF)-like protein
MLIDVDFFKMFNDTYGHSKGDDCLRLIAQTINKVITRKGDFTARYGGEEFAVVMPGTDETGTHTVAEKILKAIRELKIPHEKTKEGIVTISIGIATGCKTNTQYWTDYFKKADEALYISKNNGRDRSTFLPFVS